MDEAEERLPGAPVQAGGRTRSRQERAVWKNMGEMM